jgi:8-oxo-dGTP pyrophosphatase MutT (NUDIX family)/phosphohistidine phosphatase SixA
VISPRPGLPAGTLPDAEADAPSGTSGGPGTVTASGPPGPAPDIGDPPDLVAAGTVCWRRAREGSGLEVLIVHRPRYDDWSWPKGKPERREDLAECAVREAAEEAGVQVVLGRPLPLTRYHLPGGQLKEVSYWAARVVGSGRPKVPNREVDRTAWVPLDEASRRLTHATDTEPLATLAAYSGQGTLPTAACLVLRNATPRPRDAWARADADRPLVASGKRQAMALAALLGCWRPDYVLCSPWRRCVQTMTPYAAASGTRIRTKAGLAEDSFRRSPGKARRHTHRVLDNAHGGVLCTHRPVLDGVVQTLREYCTAEVAQQLPVDDPLLDHGEMLVAHVAHPMNGGRLIVAIERHSTR